MSAMSGKPDHLTAAAPAAPPAPYHQRFAVEYDYPVHFTRDLFSRDNPVFVLALTRKEPDKRHRFVAFIDADVAASWPQLAASSSSRPWNL